MPKLRHLAIDDASSIYCRHLQCTTKIKLLFFPKQILHCLFLIALSSSFRFKTIESNVRPISFISLNKNPCKVSINHHSSHVLSYMSCSCTLMAEGGIEDKKIGKKKKVVPFIEGDHRVLKGSTYPELGSQCTRRKKHSTEIARLVRSFRGGWPFPRLGEATISLSF